MLKAWRGMRGLSQLDLSLETGVSQKHLSFIESGRSTPSRQTLMAVADGLDMPYRERNQLLLAAGFAPQYPEAGWDAAGMAIVRHALERMVANHEPYPAVVMDRWWNVLMANRATSRLFSAFIDLDRWPRPRNLLHLLFDPTGLRPFVPDWPRFSASMLRRVRREAVAGVMDEDTQALLASLRAYPGVDEAMDGEAGMDDLPVIPLTLANGDLRLSYFSLVTTVGTPRASGSEELRVECMSPVDVITEAWHGGDIPPA